MCAGERRKSLRVVQDVHSRLSSIESTTKSERQEGTRLKEKSMLKTCSRHVQNILTTLRRSVQEMEKKLESNKKELQSLVAGLEEKYGSGGGEEVKKGAEAQIMKKA